MLLLSFIIVARRFEILYGCPGRCRWALFACSLVMRDFSDWVRKVKGVGTGRICAGQDKGPLTPLSPPIPTHNGTFTQIERNIMTKPNTDRIDVDYP